LLNKIDIFKNYTFLKNKMSSFPLYDNLKKDLVKKDLTAKQKQELLDNIIKLDNNTKEIIYVLIQYYSIDVDSNKDSNIIPYNAIEKSTENKELFDISWSITDIPIPLRQMLYKFITLHKQKEEEVKRDF
jgi:hypothetical protein